MKPVIPLLIFAAFLPAQGVQKFTGTITDSMCAKGDHTQMRMGPSDAECTIACVDAHGALFVLFDGSNAYNLSDQKSPEKLAGKKVQTLPRELVAPALRIIQFSKFLTPSLIIFM